MSILLYPTSLLRTRGRITYVDYPSQADKGTQVSVRAIMQSLQPWGTPIWQTEFLFNLINAVTREMLSFRGWFTVTPESTHEETLIFTMPTDSIQLELQLRYRDPTPMGVMEDQHFFTVGIVLISLLVKSSPFVGVPVRIDGVEQVTPAYFEISEGIYTVLVPSSYQDRLFVMWEDGSKSPQRLLTIAESKDITAYYEGAPVDDEEVPWYEKYKWPLVGAAVATGLVIISSQRK